MAEKVTVATLHQMKREGRRIAVGVCYEAQMAQILERAGVDMLSVGDSVGRVFLAHTAPDALTVDEMIPFCRAVRRVAQRALVNCDLPDQAARAGPRAAAAAARRLASEAGAEMVKVDTREDMDGLFPVVEAVIATGIPTYPQIGYDALGPLHGGAAVRDEMVHRAQALERAGAAAIDLTAVTRDIYGAVARAVRIPVLGGQAGPEADGKIYVSYNLVGYQAAALERADDRPNVARTILEIATSAFANVRAGQF